MLLVPADCLHHLRFLCAETQQNLDFVRGAGFAPALAKAPQVPLVPAAAKENSGAGGCDHRLSQLSSDVAGLQLSHAALASSLQQLSQLQLSCARLQQEQGGFEDSVGRLRARVEELSERLGGALVGGAQRAGQSEELAGCKSRIQALQREQASLAQSLQRQLATLREACPGPGLGKQVELLQSQLEAGQKEASAQRAEQAAAVAQLQLQLDEAVARLGGLGDVKGWEALTAEALQDIRAQIATIAGAQEQQEARLGGLEERWQRHEVELPGSRPPGAEEGKPGGGGGVGATQLQALQQSMDELAQVVFDLRVDVQNAGEDTGIGVASARRQAEEAAEAAESLAVRAEGLEARIGGLQGQLDALQRTMEALTPSRSSGWGAWLDAAGGDDAGTCTRELPQPLVQLLRSWLQGELQCVRDSHASHAAQLLQLGEQVAGLRGLPDSVSRLEASTAALQEQLQQVAASQQEQAGRLAAAERGAAEVPALRQGLEGQASALRGLEGTLDALRVQHAASREALEAVLGREAGVEEAVRSVQGSVRVCEARTAEQGDQLALLRRAVSAAERVAADAAALASASAAAGGTAGATAEREAEVAQLGVRLAALEESASRAPAELCELKEGLQACVARTGQFQRELEGRVGRMELAVAGAIEEVASQMARLEAHVGEVGRAASSSAQHAQQAATAATLSAVQVHRKASAGGSQRRLSDLGGSRGGSQELLTPQAPPCPSSSCPGSLSEPPGHGGPEKHVVGQQAQGCSGACPAGGHRRRSGGSADGAGPGTGGLPCARSSSQSGSQEAPAAAGRESRCQPESLPSSPGGGGNEAGVLGEEKSLRELFGAGASFTSSSSRRPSRQPSRSEPGDENIRGQVLLLERALAAGGLDEVQREMMEADLEYLRSQLGGE